MSEVVRVPTAPGSQGSAPEPASPSQPVGADPSRLRDAVWSGVKAFAKWIVTGVVPLALISFACFSVGREYGRRQGNVEMRHTILCVMERLDDELPEDNCYRLGEHRHRDSDGNPQGGDGTAPSRSDDSAGLQGIAQPHPQPVGSETATDAAKREGGA